MVVWNLENFKGGWFAGNFDPSCIKTEAFECAVKYYCSGDIDKPHYHAIATEVTVVISGEVRMNGKNYSKGDIIIIEPNEVTCFIALTDAVTAVVKIPSVIGDKHDAKGEGY